ncbi:glycine--tRNA ligase subunit beta [Novosphingobium aquimarinum]|uniref:glycine--tRNA ligase subunit beta n=1 Tax=Novosphingobium aquimarinum TaxID=2682494 RepID=UPI0012EB360A|nr:glycine--tRNA ligase subunit beta [Novosphingobium aquimarinum]
MPDFLLELRSEEIPARMQAGARADLEKLFRKEMDAAGVSCSDITVWSTPRRLALIARDVPTATEAVREETKGPATAAPEQALAGFLGKVGLTKDQLEVRELKGKPTYFAVVEKPGRAVADVLAEAIPAMARAFPWPKSMRWGAQSLSSASLRWVRPLSGVVAILGEELVECEVGGIASGYVTLGHRFHAPGEITIGGAHDYADKLRLAHVIVDHEERQGIVRTKAREAASAAGLTLVEDEGLVIENAGLTEWPVPLLGRFDEDYLAVPPEVIQLTARVNQKYFVCNDADGKLANAFVCTANIDATDGGAGVVDGNRKVLAARLSDARFFWDQDRKTPLAEQAKKLERITFHEKLGTVADKVERVAKLARWLVEEGIVTSSPNRGGGPAKLVEGQAPPILTPQPETTPPVPLHSPAEGPPPRSGEVLALADMAEQAARLAKADLVTEMVGEFPELQGLMGGYYARAEGLPDAVADAIRDHYKPVGQGDEVPTAPVTVAVSLADKLDTLVGFYLIKQEPTGSKDPFALRRAALGLIAMAIENKLPLNAFLIAANAYHPASWNAKLVALSQIGLFHKDDLSSVRKALYAQTESYRFELTPHTIEIDVDRRSILRAESNDGSFEVPEILGPIDLPTKIVDFLVDRLKVQQREAGVRHDLIDAVFALGGEDDLVRLLARVHALQAFVETEDGTNLLAGYKRAANILKKEGFDTPDRHPSSETASESGMPDQVRHDVEGVYADEDPMENVDDPQMREIYAQQMAERTATALSYTPEPAEKALMDALDSAEPAAARAVEAEDFAAAMAALAGLRAPIDAFFEDVTVNDADPAKRHTRLALLDRFRVAVHNVADFSKIEG